jgi:hypothetical protein
VSITGDGIGATAVATIVNNKVYSVTVTNPGTGYTNAIATVIPAVGDTTGQAAALVVNLQGRYGTIRSYYNDAVKGKIIVSSNAGTIDYTDGIVTLTNFNPYSINNTFGQLTLSVKPTTNIISSTLNRLITIDPYDSSAVNVNVTTKKN